MSSRFPVCLALLALLAWSACAPSPGAQTARAPDPLVITRWSQGHELFVELDAPVVGTAFRYAAHVTRLADNRPATLGVLGLRFEQDGFAIESHRDEGATRPGVFSGQAPSPSQPGPYRLFFSYVEGEERAEWDAGVVNVGKEAAVPHIAAEDGEITFLKEAQWQVPFAVAATAERLLAEVVQASATVQPSPDTTAVVAAPVDGLVAWTDTLPVVGRTVKRGDRLATLVPAGAAENWATMHADLATARIERELAQADLARVEGLAPEALVSSRRVDEVRAALARADAKVEAAERRVSALSSSGTSAAVPIRAPADGLVVAVGAAHGQSVAAGAPLVSVNAGSGVLVEGRVHEKGLRSLRPVASLTVHRGDWSAPVDLLAAGSAVLTEQLVYDRHTLSAPVVVEVPGEVGLVPGDLVELSLGVGIAAPRLAVPRSAVVEINGQDVVFVQVSGESFTRRRVALGAHDATHVEITRGLSLGEMVVVQGGFDVHVASLSGALESHRH